MSEDLLLYTLHQYSENQLWINLSPEEKVLLEKLEQFKIQFNFPAVKNDVGQMLNFLTKAFSCKTIFEFGSGYGHSAFWYFVQNNHPPQKVYLTERRTDLQDSFNSIKWSSALDYFCGDAFERLQQIEAIDLCLLDGQKSQYLEFLQKLIPRLNPGAIIVIDNAFIKGQFLDKDLQHKDIVQKTNELHQFLRNQKFEKVFMPVRDGLLILKKVN